MSYTLVQKKIIYTANIVYKSITDTVLSVAFQYYFVSTDCISKNLLQASSLVVVIVNTVLTAIGTKKHYKKNNPFIFIIKLNPDWARTLYRHRPRDALCRKTDVSRA